MKRSVYRSYTSHWRSIVSAGLVAMGGALAETGALVSVATFAPSLGDPSNPVLDLDLGPIAVSGTVNFFLGAAAVLITIAMSLRAVAAYISARATASWTATRRKAIVRAYMRAPFTFIAGVRPARLQELVGQHSRLAGQVISHLTTALNAALSLLVFMGSALLLDPRATVVFFVLGTISILAIGPVLRWTRRKSRQIANLNVELGLTVTETTGVIREVRTLGVRDQIEDRIKSRVDRLASIVRKVNFVLGVTPQLFLGIGMLVLLATFAVAAQLASGTFATLGGTALLLFRALTFGQQISGIQQRLNRAFPYTEQINDFTAEATAGLDARDEGTVSIDRINSIEFVDTSFSYTGDDDFAISSTTFSLSRPDLVAIVGPSGTGKTTVAHLALGLLDPSKGVVSINGTPIPEIITGDLPGLLALVPQEPVILHASVMDNIQFYRSHVSEEQVIEVAKSIGIHDTIMALEHGYETEIGESTRGLSGGQRQRVAIARALAGNPSMIILDEPTSALDSESESWVMQTLTDLGERALALVIAHRPETIERCHAVLRFDDGSLVEHTRTD